MNRKVAAVLNGYTRLTSSEQAEFLKELNRFVQGDQQLRKSVNEDIRSAERMELGPMRGGCPCCGR